MQHADILARHHMNQFARFDMPYFDERRLKRKNVRVIERERLRRTLPLDFPVRSRAPAIPIYKEAEIRVVQEELPVQSFDVDRFDILFPSHEIK